MLQFSQKQFDDLESKVIPNQLKQMVLDYANEIESEDADLADRIRSLDEETSLSIFTKIYNLTSIRDYQRTLLALFADTEVDIFQQEEFAFIINHSFLSGDAKARHIILSCINIKGRE